MASGKKLQIGSIPPPKGKPCGWPDGCKLKAKANVVVSVDGESTRIRVCDDHLNELKNALEA